MYVLTTRGSLHSPAAKWQKSTILYHYNTHAELTRDPHLTRTPRPSTLRSRYAAFPGTVFSQVLVQVTKFCVFNFRDVFGGTLISHIVLNRENRKKLSSANKSDKKVVSIFQLLIIKFLLMAIVYCNLDLSLIFAWIFWQNDKRHEGPKPQKCDGIFAF